VGRVCCGVQSHTLLVATDRARARARDVELRLKYPRCQRTIFTHADKSVWMAATLSTAYNGRWEQFLPVGNAPSLLSVKEFLSDSRIQMVTSFDEVPHDWRAYVYITKPLRKPWSINRTSALTAMAYDRHMKKPVCVERTPVGPLVSIETSWHHGTKVALNDWPFMPHHFTHAYVLAVPWGFMGDNHIFGSAIRVEATQRRLLFGMSRFWSSSGSKVDFRNLYANTSRRPRWAGERDVDVIVNIDSWQGSSFQHFVLDALPRLALVYKLLIEKRSEVWSRARVVFNMAPPGIWFMRALGLYNRTLPGIGWAIEAPSVYRARLALYPDYGPAPISSPSRYDQRVVARHGVHPYGSLWPIQRALGGWDSHNRKLVVYIQRLPNAARSLPCEIEQVLLDGIRRRLAERSSNLGWQLKVVRKPDLDDVNIAQRVFRNAVIVIGAHGGGLANIIFCKPGTTLIELYPVVSASYRTSKFAYYGLAQGAALEYWFVEARGSRRAQGFDMPLSGIDPRDVLDAVDHAMASTRTATNSRVVQPTLNTNASNRGQSSQTSPSTAVQVSPLFLEHLRSLPPIPKRIHMIWPDKGVINSRLPMVMHGLRKLKDLNPEWNLTVYDSDDIDAYLRATSFLSERDKSWIDRAHIIEKTDAFRLIILIEQGGFFQDMDRVYNVPLDDVIRPETRMLLPTYFDINFAQDIMCTSPGALRNGLPARCNGSLPGPASLCDPNASSLAWWQETRSSSRPSRSRQTFGAASMVKGYNA
jgi:hypothetical protein